MLRSSIQLAFFVAFVLRMGAALTEADVVRCAPRENPGLDAIEDMATQFQASWASADPELTQQTILCILSTTWLMHCLKGAH
jgi:hypothetical protein